MNLDYLFKPKCIAIVGANAGESFAGACCHSIENYVSDQSRIYYVNPKYDDIRGKRCYKNILDIDDDIDLLVISTNKKLVKGIILDGLSKNVKACIVYASGFAECENGISFEDELKEIALKYDLPIMGPNCAGYWNFIDNIPLFAFLSEKRDRKGHIGIVSQSGMIGLSLLDNQMLKFSYNISCGNANIVTFADCINYLIDDMDTDVIGLYADGIREREEFIICLIRAKAAKKKIVILKMGRSEKSRLLSMNHTGTKDVFDENEFNELLKKYKVYRAYDLEEFIYTLLIVEYTKNIDNIKGFASLNLSGGEANIATEVGESYGIKFPNFSDKVANYLTKRLPSYAHISNPLDMTVTLSYDEKALADAINLIMDENEIDAIVIGYTLLRQIDDPCIYYIIKAVNILKEKRKEKMKPIFLMCYFSCTRNQESIEKLLELGVVVLPTPMYGFKILKNLGRI